MLTADYSSSLQGLGLQGFHGFAIERGIAVPDDLATLGTFQGLQRAVNAGLRARGLPTIGVDGEIGSTTLTAVRTLAVPGTAGLATDVNTLAANAAAAASLIAVAFGSGANFTPDPAAPRPPAKTFPAAVIPRDGNGMGKLLLIGGAALLGVGVVIWVVRRKRKK